MTRESIGMWFAFRMSGFGGLLVPERVVGRAGETLVKTESDVPGWMNVRCIGVDGALFATLEECLAYCEGANGIPVFAQDGQIGLNEVQARAEVRRAIGRELNKHERAALESGRRAGRADALAESGEEPVVQVVNVQGLKGAARAGVVYCGRPSRAGWKGHPLANPFALGRDGTRDECVAKYRLWLLARPTLDADLAALWEQTRRGELPLGCWCAPESCHCDVLAELLAERFGGE